MNVALSQFSNKGPQFLLYMTHLSLLLCSYAKQIESHTLEAGFTVKNAVKQCFWVQQTHCTVEKKAFSTVCRDTSRRQTQKED